MSETWNQGSLKTWWHVIEMEKKTTRYIYITNQLYYGHVIHGFHCSFSRGLKCVILDAMIETNASGLLNLILMETLRGALVGSCER